MLFDTLCKEVERNLQGFSPLCKEARIFRLDGEPPVEWDPEQMNLDNIRLPFEVVALERATDRGEKGLYCILLKQTQEQRVFEFLTVDQGSTNRGVSVAWGKINYFPNGWVGTTELDEMIKSRGGIMELTVFDPSVGRSISIDPKTYHDFKKEIDREPVSDETRELYSRLMDPAYSNNLSRLEEDREKAKKAIGEFETTKSRLEQEMIQCIASIHIVHLLTSARDLIFINSPKMFVLEEAPIKPGKIPPNPLLRSPWREHYIVLNPTTIRSRLNLPGIEEPNGVRAPHERRAHWRTYHDPRYKNMKGNRTWINACWIGPREAILGPNRYTVRIDL